MDNLTSQALAAAIETAYWTKLLFWATAILAITTLLLAAAAVWGDWLRARLWDKPQLKIALLSKYGEKYRGTASVDIVYYRVVVTNEGRKPATEVVLHLTKVELFENGSPVVKWESETPLNWMHWQHVPTRPTVGPKATCDLLKIDEHGYLVVAAAFVPTNLVEFVKHPVGLPVHMILTVEARSIESTSRPYRFDVDWNGEWEDDPARMAEAVRITELAA